MGCISKSIDLAIQYKAIPEIECLIRFNNSTAPDAHHYSTRTIRRFKKTIKHLEKSAEMLCYVDRLVEGYDNEAKFSERWKEKFSIWAKALNMMKIEIKILKGAV